ncbi:mevalonate kinase, partial [Lasius niger]
MYAVFCEEVMQGYDFAIDNRVCSHGQIIRFHLVNPEYYGVQDLEVPRINILLIDSNIRQNRDERAQQTVELKYSYPEFDLILNSFDEISHKISTTLDEINYNHNNHNLLYLQQNCYAHLQIYIHNSQQMLHNFGLSHPRFDTIASIARDFGFGGKLTGFGGGFAYILLPPSVSEEQITNLSTRFMEEGFEITMTS